MSNALVALHRTLMKGLDHEVFVLNGGGFIRLPKLGWDDLILPGDMGAEIRRNVESFLRARDHYRKLRLPFRRGLLFVGPPGGGKSTAAKIIMANVKARPLLLSLRDEIKDSTIESAFREAASLPPAILLIEDLDKLTSSKNVAMSYLLNLLDGLETHEGFLLIATSNEPEKIDRALLHRPSRFDRVFHFGLPGTDERRRLLALRGQGRFLDQALAEAAEATAGLTLAYVQEVVVSAMLSALHEGREPQDTDLLASAKRLQEQYHAGQRATGDLRPVQPIGFGALDERATPITEESN
ncbi:MAG: ATP-binding protein [Actinomycetota bacterium]